MTDQWPIGSHVVYVGKSYRFPGEVTMRDDTGVVVKAFGDMDGNYTGMKHIYADGVLAPYEFMTGQGLPPLVVFADETPMRKIEQYIRLHPDAANVVWLKLLLKCATDMARIRDRPDDAAIEALRDHLERSGRGAVTVSREGLRKLFDAYDRARLPAAASYDDSLLDQEPVAEFLGLDPAPVSTDLLPIDKR